MRLAARLRDATRSPQRLWWLGVRVVKLALRGELPDMLARLWPRSPSAEAYRAWLATHAPPTAGRLAAPPLREIRIDLADTRAQERVAARFARLDAAPSRVRIRGAGGAFVPTGGSAAPTETSGDGVLLVGADVVPAPDLCVRLASALAAHPAAVAVYADCDHLDAQGRRERPVLASAFDAEQAFERIACGPLLVLRDGDALRASESAPPGEGVSAALVELAAMSDARVLHVPDVLCHRTSSEDVGPTDERHAARAVTAARRRGALADFAATQRPHIRFAAPVGTTLSVVLATRDRADLVRRSVASLPEALLGHPVEIVVVDNGSTQPELATLCRELAQQRALRVIRRPEPFNFSALCNAGAAQARGDVLLFLNNDAFFAEPGGVDELVALAARPWTGAVGPWLYYEDGRVQSAGVLVGVNRSATSALAGYASDDPAAVAWGASRRRVSSVLGACLAIGRRKFEQVDGFDERFAVSHNEIDLCLRIEAAGYANVVTPYARVVHVEGATRGFEVAPGERTRRAAEERLFRERWHARMDAVDPAHHPWRARRGEPFAFASGPVDATPRLGWCPAHG